MYMYVNHSNLIEEQVNVKMNCYNIPCGNNFIVFHLCLPEEQQKQLQSSVSLLSPAGEDLAEIKQQEQQIVNLLNEQRRQESELQRLHLLQQQRLEEQSNSFTHERKVCTIEATCTCKLLFGARSFGTIPE